MPVPTTFSNFQAPLLKTMVSARRNPSPSPPEISGARRVHDDPPPETTHNADRGNAHLDQSPSHRKDHVNVSTSLAQISANDETQSATPRRENDTVNIANGSNLTVPSVVQPDVQRNGTLPPEVVITEVDDQDSDAPEEASATFAAEAALAQRALERDARNSVREQRRMRRRGAAGKQRREALGRKEHTALSQSPVIYEEEIEATNSAGQGGDKEIGGNTGEPSLLLSEEMLEAAQRAVREKRRAERERRKGKKLKRQNKKVSRHLTIKQVAGVEIQIAGRVQKKTEARGLGNRNPATTFLERCIRNAGTRVPSTVAARIASAAKRRKK